ncbi:MAG: CPBP family intramembrane glutamic endopeptidase [Oscillospiraceae bacterium]
MNADKKKMIIRIVIFVILSYAPMIAISALFDVNGTITGEEGRVYTLCASLAGFTPMAANILTRLITKEGFSDNYLRANFRGNLKYYFLGIVYAVLGSLLSTILLIILYCPDYSLSDVGLGSGMAAMFLLTLAMDLETFWITFGEEFGWRAYLTPKLEKLMPEPLALIVGGIIWGLWHAPLTVHGHNFGFGYWGFPFTGFAAMSVSCIFVGSFLTWLTKKTGSVYPSSICHACINGMVIPALLIPNYAELCEEHNFVTGAVLLGVNALLGVGAFIMLCKKKKPAEENEVKAAA